MEAQRSQLGKTDENDWGICSEPGHMLTESVCLVSLAQLYFLLEIAIVFLTNYRQSKSATSLILYTSPQRNKFCQ